MVSPRRYSSTLETKASAVKGAYRFFTVRAVFTATRQNLSMSNGAGLCMAFEVSADCAKAVGDARLALFGAVARAQESALRAPLAPEDEPGAYSSLKLLETLPQDNSLETMLAKRVSTAEASDLHLDCEELPLLVGCSNRDQFGTADDSP